MADLFREVLLSLLEAKLYKIELSSGKTMNKELTNDNYKNMLSNIGTPGSIIKSITPIESKTEEEPSSVKPNYDKAIQLTDEDVLKKLYPKPGQINYREIGGSPDLTGPAFSDCIREKLKSIPLKSKPSLSYNLKITCITNTVDYPTPQDAVKELGDRIGIYPSEVNGLIEFVKKIRRDYEIVKKCQDDINKAVEDGKFKQAPLPLKSAKSDIRTYLNYYESAHNSLDYKGSYNFFLNYIKSNL